MNWFEVEFLFPRGGKILWLGPAESARAAYELAIEDEDYQRMLSDQGDWHAMTCRASAPGQVESKET